MDRAALNGAEAETLACQHLKRQGLKLIQRNFHSRFGEIDLIMRDGKALVFVEVRYRKNSQFGTAGESVDRHKQRKLTATANAYLSQQPPCPARFDVVAVSPSKDGFTLDWIQDAFGV